jgi:HTH-type transcriptional regulator / antitoxin HigA
MEPKPIHTAADHKAAMAEMERLWDSRDAADIQRLADWGELVDLYETRRIKAARNLDPISVLRAEMEMNGRSRADLAAIVGQNRATEILKRKRPLTLQMIRALVREWGIPADLLIAEYETV